MLGNFNVKAEQNALKGQQESSLKLLIFP